MFVNRPTVSWCLSHASVHISPIYVTIIFAYTYLYLSHSSFPFLVSIFSGLQLGSLDCPSEDKASDAHASGASVRPLVGMLRACHTDAVTVKSFYVHLWFIYGLPFIDSVDHIISRLSFFHNHLITYDSILTDISQNIQQSMGDNNNNNNNTIVNDTDNNNVTTTTKIKITITIVILWYW